MLIDVFEYTLHKTLEGLEQELVQLIRERVLKEGDAFPGEVNKIEATVEVDLNAVLRTASSSRVVRQVQQSEGS
jgi:hypothetical protein